MNKENIGDIIRTRKSMEATGKQLSELLNTYTMAQVARDRTAQTEVQAFVEVGQFLIARKAEFKGQWENWLTEYFPQSQHTACRWMRATTWYLSKGELAHALGVNSVAALMRASLTDQRPRVGDVVEFTLALALRYLKPLQRLDEASVFALPQADQVALRAALEPTRMLCDKLPKDHFTQSQIETSS